mgnify:CR=1 FL=1
MKAINFPVDVFVYGTLKKGGHNHVCLQDANATFVYNAKTKELRRLIVSGLPYLCDGYDEGGHHVEGEIYRIPDARGLSIIDRLESNGTFYKRRVDEFLVRDKKTGLIFEREAWVYYILANKEGEPQPRFEVNA